MFKKSFAVCGSLVYVIAKKINILELHIYIIHLLMLFSVYLWKPFFFLLFLKCFLGTFLPYEIMADQTWHWWGHGAGDSLLPYSRVCS